MNALIILKEDLAILINIKLNLKYIWALN